MPQNNSNTYSSSPIRIALDAMGGDFAPNNEVAGAIEALESSSGIEIVLVGKEDVLSKELSKYSQSSASKCSILHADDVVTMDDEPAVAFRKKRNSSLYKGIEILKEGKVDAFVSAGNTGAVMTMSTLLLGRIAGVSRPTIGSFFPTMKDSATLVMDVGANVDSKPKHLAEFAIMGNEYAKNIRHIDNPRIGLLNVGEEKSKGNEVAISTHELLSNNASINFIGNVEGRDILKGTADIVLCDGFTGNIILKFAESFLGLLKSRFKLYSEQGIMQKLAVGAIRPVLRRVLQGLDYQQYGGVPLLGVNGVVIIGHGSSTVTALKNMILVAQEMVQKDVNNNIERALASPPETMDSL